MGRIRTADIKVLARDIKAAYPDRISGDFDENKALLAELNILSEKSKKYRNKVAGYMVRVKKMKVTQRLSEIELQAIAKSQEPEK